MKSSRGWNIAGLGFLIVIIWLLVNNYREVEVLIARVGYWGPLLVISLYGLLAATPVTTDPLTIMAAGIYGPVAGLIISMVGNLIAALVEYYVGRHIEKITDFKKEKYKLPFGLEKLPASHPLFLIFGRMVPGYGSKILSIVAGIYQVPIGRYLWTTVLTNLLGGIILSFGGYRIIYLLK